MAAAAAVLGREGRNARHLWARQRPARLPPLREFLVAKLKRDAGIACAADNILVTSGSLQALDLVNGSCSSAATPSSSSRTPTRAPSTA